jgi:diketogulonate reductase-like aldo/keto reductase
MSITITSTVKLSNGVEFPIFGLGTYLSKEKEAYTSTLAALKNGYIHIDTAQVYGNEDQVGQAIKDSGVDRSKIFITTKLWFSNFAEDKAYPSLEESLKKLQVDYVDLVLLHTPGMPVKVPGNPEEEKTKREAQDGATGRALRKSAWLALEKFYNAGKTRAIGVSNFWPVHIDQINEFATVKVHVNQIEFHPWNQREKQVTYCRENGIVVEGWAPFGQGKKLQDPTLKKIGEKYHKSGPQVSVRWHLQKGIVVIPKSVHDERVVENANVFDFELTPEEMKEIDGLEEGYLCAPVWEHDDVL